MLSLKKLEMVKNKVEDEGASHLAEGLSKSSTLSTLRWLSHVC
jgi:hypothetical protein